jgi:hypothetical protein
VQEEEGGRVLEYVIGRPRLCRCFRHTKMPTANMPLWCDPPPPPKSTHTHRSPALPPASFLGPACLSPKLAAANTL